MDASALWDVNATRYLEAIGLTVLFYDHALTFAHEVDFVWTAPASFAKYTFLFNRYLVLSVLMTVAAEMCGFLGDVFTDEHRCRGFLFSCSMIAVISVGIANMLVLLRVVILWDHRPLILKLMTFAFVTSLIAQVTMMILTLLRIIPSVTWSSTAGMCVVTERTNLIVAVWASPMLFELFVLVSTALNALDRPTSANTPLVKALNRDGIGYFVAVTCLRCLNVALATINRSAFTLLGVFFVWAMTTTVLNRSLLHLRPAEATPEDDLPLRMRSASPFALGSPVNASMDVTESTIVMEDDYGDLDEIWASRLEDHRYHYRKRSVYEAINSP